ncbi:hypothetical protein DJ018_08470 [Phenylobacterium deserti]|uniref:Uncharacterized protein n=2 Tax=Phenylobacterium deserti TaxID=1914756 RepID=A0A328AW44_9CAUL|nr:hypothetical protein DJ018_08470 [Phenylobacterium deserti]
MGAAALAGAPSLAHAQALNLLYERTVMIAADQRCGLFTPAVSAALGASAAQARGAALRAGQPRNAVEAAEGRARARARQTACGSPDLAVAAARVRDAFAGYSKISRLTYPGDVAGWSADRNFSRTTRWRLVQDNRFGSDRILFGLAGKDAPSALVAVGSFPDGAKPYGARLMLRDVSRSTGPYLARWSSGATAGLSLERRVPPRSMLVGFTAEARSVAGSDLRPKDMKTGWAFRFPAAAAGAMGRLDPREAVVVEFLFPGDVVRRAYVEVGDFAAGSAFLRVAAR